MGEYDVASLPLVVEMIDPDDPELLIDGLIQIRRFKASR